MVSNTNNIKFYIKSYNNEKNYEIIQYKINKDKVYNDALIDINKNKKNLLMIKNSNEIYLLFINNLIYYLHKFIDDIFILNFNDIINNDSYIFYLGIWLVLFSIILHVFN